MTLSIGTENFAADVTRKRKQNFHIGLSNEGAYYIQFFTIEKVSICITSLAVFSTLISSVYRKYICSPCV